MFRWSWARTFKLTPGRHEIKIVPRETGLLIDALAVIKNELGTPDGMVVGNRLDIEVESGTLFNYDVGQMGYTRFDVIADNDSASGKSSLPQLDE